jgi:ribonuclease Y
MTELLPYGIAVLVVAGVASTVFFYSSRKRAANALIDAAQKRADELVADAESRVDTILKEARLEGREQLQTDRTAFEDEVRERRAQLLNSENRLHEREEGHINLLREEAAGYRDEAVQRLERASSYNRDDARAELVRAMAREAREEGTKVAQRIIEKARTTANREAQRVIALAIQRSASSHVAENTVSVVELPSDDMKGRVIGREGRNIRAFEMMAGVNLIVDDTPEAVLISSFDPYRREIAKQALEKLVADGRIHPARIEEVVEQVKAEIDEQTIAEGLATAAEVGVHDLNAELVRLFGMLKYRTSYGQNVMRHSAEVATIAGIMAAELGGNELVARRGGLLHDIGKAIDQEVEGTHLQIGIDLLRKHGESEEVVQAMEAHHFDVEPATLEAVLVQAADALSAARPGARRDMLETYVKRLEKLEQIADSFRGVAKAYAIQAGRELRIIVEPNTVSDDESVWLSRDIANRIEREVQFPGEIKVTVIRETRAVEIAH